VLKRGRRRACELAGSDRYSRPSLGGLETKLAEHLPQRGGVFVEAGAYDGYWQSNTYWLERFRGWSGVLVEPVPELAALARRERPDSTIFQCALVGAESGVTTVEMLFGGTMSMVRGAWGSDEAELARAVEGLGGGRARLREITVPARTLTSLLDEAGVGDFDFLSLDVEGHELDCLRGLDLSRHAPRVAMIEIVDATEKLSEVQAILGAGYRMVAQLSSWDYLFERTDARLSTK
jgi:FkbM family methyltransferase